jgi:hypothetical protein
MTEHVKWMSEMRDAWTISQENMEEAFFLVRFNYALEEWAAGDI